MTNHSSPMIVEEVEDPTANNMLAMTTRSKANLSLHNSHTVGRFPSQLRHTIQLHLSQSYGNNFEDAPPLFWPHLARNTNSIISKVVDGSIMNDTDLARTMVSGLAFGATLLLAGKIQFGHEYGWHQCNWMSRNVLFIKLTVFYLDVWQVSLDIVFFSWSYLPALQWYFLGRMVQKSFSLLELLDGVFFLLPKFLFLYGLGKDTNF